MESIFEDMSSEVGSECSEEKKSEKPKRSAFVFVTTEIDDRSIALEDLRKIREVKEVYLAHGAYDIVARVSGESFDHLREIVLKQIRNLSSIKSTLALTIV